jgi:hypothetical protein
MHIPSMKSLLACVLVLAASCAIGFAVPSGEPSKGLATRIELAATKFAVGDSIEVRYTKTNVSEKPLSVWHSGFWPNHRIRVCDQLGALAPLTEQGKLRFKAFAPGGARDKNFPNELAPGKDAPEPAYNLLDMYDLKKPGLYSVQYLYEEYQSGWQGQVWSNVVIIEIAEK